MIRAATRRAAAAQWLAAAGLAAALGCSDDGAGGPPPVVTEGDAVDTARAETAALAAAGPFALDVVDFGDATETADGVRAGGATVHGLPGRPAALAVPAACDADAPIACRTLGSLAHVVVQGEATITLPTTARALGLHVSLTAAQREPLEALEPRRGVGLAFMLPQLRVLVTALDADGEEGATIRAIPASATYRSTEVADDWLWIDTHVLGRVSGLRLRVDSPIDGLDTVLVDNVATSTDYADDLDFFAAALIPDTQKYSEKAELRPIFRAQTAWVAANQDAQRVAFASHLGDIVENGHVPEEWASADLAMAELDGRVPYGLVIGNHDFEDWSAPERGSPLFEATFPASRYEGEPWWGGRAPDGLGSWQRFETPEGPFLYLHLSVDSPPPTVAWATGVIEANPGVPTAITTHVYLRENGRVPVPYMTATASTWPGISADEVFETLVAPNPQVFLVTCGHIAAEHLQVSDNDAGQPVYELLQDYQNRVDGGEGFLRLLRFYPRRREIRALTYSPWLDTWEVDADSHFTLSDARVPGWD